MAAYFGELVRAKKPSHREKGTGHASSGSSCQREQQYQCHGSRVQLPRSIDLTPAAWLATFFLAPT